MGPVISSFRRLNYFIFRLELVLRPFGYISFGFDLLSGPRFVLGIGSPPLVGLFSSFSWGSVRHRGYLPGVDDSLGPKGVTRGSQQVFCLIPFFTFLLLSCTIWHTFIYLLHSLSIIDHLSFSCPFVSCH